MGSFSHSFCWHPNPQNPSTMTDPVIEESVRALSKRTRAFIESEVRRVAQLVIKSERAVVDVRLETTLHTEIRDRLLEHFNIRLDVHGSTRTHLKYLVSSKDLGETRHKKIPPATEMEDIPVLHELFPCFFQKAWKRRRQAHLSNLKSEPLLTD